MRCSIFYLIIIHSRRARSSFASLNGFSISIHFLHSLLLAAHHFLPFTLSLSLTSSLLIVMQCLDANKFTSHHFYIWFFSSSCAHFLSLLSHRQLYKVYFFPYSLFFPSLVRSLTRSWLMSEEAYKREYLECSIRYWNLVKYYETWWMKIREGKFSFKFTQTFFQKYIIFEISAS